MAAFSLRDMFGGKKKEKGRKEEKGNGAVSEKSNLENPAETPDEEVAGALTGNIGIKKVIKLPPLKPKPRQIAKELQEEKPESEQKPITKAFGLVTGSAQKEQPKTEELTEAKPAQKETPKPQLEKQSTENAEIKSVKNPETKKNIKNPTAKKTKNTVKSKPKKTLKNHLEKNVKKIKSEKDKKNSRSKSSAKSVPEKKLKKEIEEFESKPKPDRVRESEKFDFTQITKQIKDKVRNAPAKNPEEFNVSAIQKQLEKEIKQGAAKSGLPAKNEGNEPADKGTSAAPQTEEKSFYSDFSDEYVSPVRTATEITRVPTGIKGLDELIEGGFEQGSSVLIVGSAGTGKTLFALQFLYNGAIEHNEPGIFITFEEERESLIRHSSAFSWDFEKLEKEGKFKIMQYKPHQVEKLMHGGGGPIKDQIKAMGAKRLVIDSITSYGLLFRDEYQRRENILGLFDLLQKWGTTSVIISELPPKVAEVREGSVGFLTDAIISLYYTKEEQKGVRVHSCEILKMRGTRHTNKLLALGFERSGLAIYPEVEVF